MDNLHFDGSHPGSVQRTIPIAEGRYLLEWCIYLRSHTTDAWFGPWRWPTYRSIPTLGEKGRVPTWPALRPPRTFGLPKQGEQR